MAQNIVTVIFTASEAPHVGPNSNGKRYVRVRGNAKNGRRTTIQTYVPAMVELLGAVQPGETLRLRGEFRRGENGAVTFSAISLALPPKGEQAAAA